MKTLLIADGAFVGFVDLDEPLVLLRQVIPGRYEQQQAREANQAWMSASSPMRDSRPLMAASSPMHDFSLETYRLIEGGVEASCHVYLYGKNRNKNEAVIRNLIARKEIQPCHS